MFRFLFAIQMIDEIKAKHKRPPTDPPLPPLLPSLPGVFLKEVRGAARRIPEFPDDVGVDHRRLDVGVTEVLLDLPDVHAVQQQMCRKAMAKRVNGHRLVDLRRHGCGVDGLLDDGFEEVMAAQSDLVERLARFEPRLVKMAPGSERPED